MNETQLAARRGWRWSSWVVAAVVLFSCVFCNLAGQIVVEMRYESESPFVVDPRLEHGWPGTYLVRDDRFRFLDGLNLEPGTPMPKGTVADCFTVWDGVEEFRPGMLIADAGIALLAAALAGAAFEAWRRQRSHLWQLHLRDLFVLVLLAAVAIGWVVHQRRQFAREASIGEGGIGTSTCQPGGFTWLGEVVGNEPFRFLDRPIRATVLPTSDWSRLEGVPSLREVEVTNGCSTEQLSHLAKLPRLEALSFVQPGPAAPDVAEAELPPLPKLRGLYLAEAAPRRFSNQLAPGVGERLRRIDRSTSLESIRIGKGLLDEQMLREIGQLANLRRLGLDGVPAGADLSFLPSLRKLTGIDFYNGDVNEAMLTAIGECATLKDVNLYMSRVDGAEMRHLAKLTQLETLNLDYVKVTSDDLAALGSLKRLRELKLTNSAIRGELRFAAGLESLEVLALYNTRVTGADLGPLVGLPRLRSLDLGYAGVRADAIGLLKQMKGLKWVRVSGWSDEERHELETALPGCEVVKH